MPPTFEDDFAKGEAEAARLVARMRASLGRAEAFEQSAKKNEQLKRRLGKEAEAEARAGKTDQPKRTPEETVRDRIKSEERLNKAIEQRVAMERRSRVATEANVAAQRRALAAGPGSAVARGPGSTLVPAGGAGGGRLPPREPPTFFYQPGQYPDDPRRRRIGPGGPFGEIPQRTGPPYPGQRALPAAGQTGQGNAGYYEREAKAKRESATAGRQYAGAAKAESAAARNLGGSLGQTTGFARSANLEFSRFGALSTEWIGAAGRGATTIQELGRQTTATIGKFGGWLGAGALLFTALDAVRAIGKGALESASGVNQLERVITNVQSSSAQSRFRDYSQAFNLPIGDVADAAYQMGKIFHDQNDALEATKAVLYSVKVGELDTATASRYLIAIINGFHLPANQLVTVFDQLNGAQNKFGITISDVEAGLAKASGAFNAATTKGSPLQKYHELLALITTAQKATGQTGQVVGTAIQRAPNFLAQDKNKAVLKKYGINAGDDLNEIITQAFARAQSLPGHKIAELASSIFGPQYGARIGTPLLQQFDLYKKVLAGTSKEATKNSGQRELNTLLGTYGERLKKVGTELESIGSGLNQAGFLNVFGLGLEALTQILNVSNSVLETFNRLPGPLKTALATLIEMRLVVGALRKFNVGDNFAPGSAGRRIFSGPNREARLYKEQLVGSEDTTRRNLETTNNQLGAAQRRVPVTAATLAAEERQLALMREQGITGKALAQQEANVARAAAANEAQLVRQINLGEERRILLGELNAIESTNTALKANFNNTEARNLAARRGEAIPGNFNRGRMSAKELGRQLDMEVGRDGNFYPVGTAVTGKQQAERAAAIQAEERAARAAAPAATFRQAGTAFKGVQQASTLKASASQFGKASLLSAAALRSSIPSIASAKTGILKAASGFRGLGASMYELAGGPLGALIAGAFLAFEYGDDLGRALAGGQKAVENAEHVGAETKARQAQRNKYITAYEVEQSKVLQALQEEGEPATPAQVRDVIEKGQGPDGVPDNFSYQDFIEQKRLREHQRRAVRKTGRAAGLPTDVVKNQIERLKEFDPGSEQFSQALANIRHNARFSAGSKKDKQANRAALDQLEAKGLNAVADVTAFFDDYNSTADKLLLNYIKNLTSLVSSGPAFAGRKDVRRLTNASIVQGVRDLVSNKPAIRAKGAQTLQELPETLASYEQDELKTSLALARTQGARERAYGKYIGSLHRNLRGVRSAFGNKGKEIASKLRETESQLKQYQEEGKTGRIDQQTAKHFGIPADAVKRHEESRVEYENLRERAKRLRRAGKEISEQQKNAERQLKALLVEQRDAQIQERVSVLGELGELASARIGGDNPVGQAQATLTFAQRALSYVRRRKGSPQALRQAQLAVLNAREQLEEAVRSEAQELAQANAALATARAHGDPIKEAQAEIQAARVNLNLARTATERKNALAELINAEHNLEEDRANIALAGLQLEAAQTDNPIKQANIKVREADAQLRNAHGKQAKLEARTNRAAAVRERRDAVAQAQIENVEFQANLGRITADQEIAAYQRILRTLKLSKQTRRSLIEKIHQLREESSGELELTVGNIQLPTLYDIRRAVGGGPNGSRQQHSYTDTSTTNIEININGGDLAEVSRTVDNSVRRKTKNSRRSAGLTK